MFPYTNEYDEVPAMFDDPASLERSSIYPFYWAIKGV